MSAADSTQNYDATAAGGIPVDGSALPFLWGALNGVIPVGQADTGAYLATLGKAAGPSTAGAVQAAYLAGGGSPDAA